jgi:ABC-type uncharacterized transport system permease subunit
VSATLGNTDELGRRVLARLRVGPTGWITTGLTVVLLVAAAALAALLIAATGGSPVDSVRAMWTGSVADWTGWTTSLLNTAPLLLVAVGTCISSTAGTFNIGQEGQVLIGGLFGAWVGLRFAIQGPMLAVVVLLAAAIGGAVWAGLSALMLHFRGVNVAVSTLLMTFVAVQLATFAVSTPWFLQETPQGATGIAASESNPLPVDGRLGSSGDYPNLQLNLGLLIALVAAGVVALLLARSKWGFRIRMVGLNPLTAKHAGVRVALVGGVALALSGAFAGLAGGVLLASPVGTNRLQAGLSHNVGWDGLLVALVARQRPMVAVPVALLFGVLRAGGDFLAATGVPYFLVDVVKSLLVLAFVAPPVLLDSYRRRRTSRTPAVQSPPPVVPTRVEVAA